MKATGMKKSTPDSATVPPGIETKDFRIRILTIHDVVKDWLSEEWWFDAVAFPGRQLSWQEWESLPDK